jgi:signal transduction histidine kinase
VRADPSGLTRALFNILDNARKYGGEDKRIFVRAAAKDGDALISIQDRGPGIAPAERERIFGRYQRGGKGETAAAGAGLGLSLAREAVEACRGTLSLESREGEGSTFFIRLPGMKREED